MLFHQVGEEVNDLETQVDAQLVERLDMEALPSGSKQVKTKHGKLQKKTSLFAGLRCGQCGSGLLNQEE